ncbi:MAG: GNAT family N-acetyltransferase [Bifidobacteriaceae bacterium]|jgi:L-amino acid N-acyltransferase YncA|nr:GNAT family N-acetyltransferase [Bifidobacteriaceae bacterium]
MDISFVLDTNAFVAMEPTSTTAEPSLVYGADLARFASQQGHKLYLAPATLDDINNDPDPRRKKTNLGLAKKYTLLADVAPPSDLLAALGQVPSPAGQSINDEIDLRILAQVWSNAVHYLVTNDIRLRKRAVRVGLGDRVLSLAEAAALLASRVKLELVPPPAVRKIKRYELDATDPLFGSLRLDYPEFDAWFSDPGKSQRPAWVIDQPQGGYAGLMILKETSDNEFVSSGKVLKVSTFKVVPDARGRSYGELLLKTLFLEAKSGGWDGIFVTVFAEKQTRLVNLFTDFGFEELPAKTTRGELVLAKSLRPDKRYLQPLDYHVSFGPPAIAPDSSVFVIPIVPAWHDILFPDWNAAGRLPIDESHRSYGNALRKAYVCQSGSRRLARGSTVVFYRSKDERAVTVVGVVEDTKVCPDPNEIFAFVSRRTVYSLNDLTGMAARGTRPLLAILFRQDRLIDPAWSFKTLQEHGVIRAAPQSIAKVGHGGTTWIHSQLAA